MRFSIIVPIYNREKSIFKTIQSVTEQTFRDWELILVNDGSTDDTEAVCNKYVQADERIVYFYQERKGVSAARNKGIEHVRGEYILFLDSDDGFVPDALQTLSEKIKEYPDADLFVFGIVGADLLKNHNTEYISKDEIMEKYLPAQLHIDSSYEKYFVEHYVWNKCYKSVFVKNKNIAFDEEHFSWEDGLFIIDCFNQVNGLAVIQKPLCRQNLYANEEHLSDKFYSNRIDNYINDAKLYEKRFGNLYDFNTEYHAGHNIRRICELIAILIKNTGKESIKKIGTIIETPLVQEWNKKFFPESKYEKLMKRGIENRAPKSIYKIHQDGILRKIYYKLKNLLKKD